MIVIPAIASVLSPQALASEILPGFGVNDVSQCQFYSGGFNDTFRVRTVGGTTYYLRAYRTQWRTKADVQCELNVLNHLKEKGYPAARPLSYKDGQPYCAVHAPEGTRYIAVFTEAPGREISYDEKSEEVAHRYGQAEAHLHNALADFSSPHPRFHLDIEYFTDHPLHHIKPFLLHRPDDWNYVQYFAKTLRARILSLPAEQLEQGFCHGDLQCYHANVAPDGTMTFFDFDCGGFGYRAYDLAVFLWCCRLEDAIAARWDSFLQGYHENRHIPELDLQAIPLFVCARYLWHMGVHTQNAPDWGIGFLGDKYFNDHLNRLKRAEEDYLAK